ncbi:MAG: hypothetical protein IIA51_11520 [Chloroflexi bacterium]|nr:hypothetical protein [Chloroflexota bacterium]
MEGFSSGQMECDNLEQSDMRPRSSKRQAAGGLLAYWPVVPFVLFLTVIAACSPEAVVETRATLDLSSIPLSTPTLEPAIFEEKNASCVNDARFVEDLTIPDGYEAKPGEVLDKQWGVLNSGSCDWGAGYRLIRIDDGLLEAPGELALYPARAGETGVWSVQVIAPDQPGDQFASWQAQSPDGAFFGDPVFVFIEIGP